MLKLIKQLKWYGRIFAANTLALCSGLNVYAQDESPTETKPRTGLESMMSTSKSKGLMKNLFRNVKDKLIIVQCDDSAGSGFVVEMEGKKFFVTNKHVVKGQIRVAAFKLDGKELNLGRFEVATNRDLVRFALPLTTDALTVNEGTPNIHENIYVFGNSDGKSVATDLSGEITGVGPEDIEVSVPFIHGNSGSAVLNEQGEVVGVATYAIRPDTSPEDWTKEGSRFSEVRRFAVRLANVEWKPMKYEDFYKACVESERKRQKDADILPQVSATFPNPLLRVFKQHSYSPYVVKGKITLSLHGKGIVKAPVIRLCMLLKSNRAEYCFKDCILTSPGSQKTEASPPVYEYGNSSSRGYPAGDGTHVFFIEGMSYYQRMFGSQKLGVKYFDTSSKSFDEYLFHIPRQVCEKMPPEIVCFRLECWQNGALAGVYNSKSSATLNAKGIPVDWFVRGKYPSRFNYSLMNSAPWE